MALYIIYWFWLESSEPHGNAHHPIDVLLCACKTYRGTDMTVLCRVNAPQSAASLCYRQFLFIKMLSKFIYVNNQSCIAIRSRYHLGTVRFWYVYYQALILTISTNATEKLWVLISSRQNSQLLPFNQILVNIAKTHIPRSFGNGGFVSVCSAFFVSF